MITGKVISARTGTSEKGNNWANMAVVVPGEMHGAQIEVVATVWGIPPETATAIQAKVDEAKASGQQVSVDLTDPKLEASNGSYENEAGDTIWRTNYTLVGGKVSNLRMTQRLRGGNADTSELLLEPAAK